MTPRPPVPATLLAVRGAGRLARVRFSRPGKPGHLRPPVRPGGPGRPAFRSLPLSAGARTRIGELAASHSLDAEAVIADLIERALAARLDQGAARPSRRPEALEALSPDDLLTSPEVAAHLRVHPKTLAKMRLAGTGPAYVKLGHRTVLYQVRDVQTHLADRLKRSTSE